jgi:hypothetical protein
VEIPPDAKAGIGHARLGTSGTLGVEDAQPLMIEEMAFAHNGTVRHHKMLAKKWGVDTITDNDSEVLGRLFRLFGYDAGEAVEELQKHQGYAPHAWIAGAGRRIWLASFGQPLHYLRIGNARYACSWPFTDSKEVAFGSVLVWDVGAAGISGGT